MYNDPIYNLNFYRQQDSSFDPAHIIVPILIDMIQPKNVIDVGCGVGIWLKVFQYYGVEEILGIDGPWIEHNIMHIPKDNFLSIDLREPFSINKKYDLVICLEVAEHLPKDCAESFIKSLYNYGSFILFSRVVPFQGGVNHLNEQWPSYWENLFNDNGFVAIDFIRGKIWNANVLYYYARKHNIIYRP
jgi:SAM-dependent methyltransferase